MHKVWIDSFLMDRHEVTQAEYEKLGKIEAFPNPSHFQGADLPVEQVTWPQAARYCNARSRLEGLQPCYNEDTGACDFEADWLPAADRSGMGIRLPGRDRFRLLVRQRSRGSSATSPGSPTTPPRRLIPSAGRSPIRGASSTCTATWPSGARMSTTRAITRPARRRTRADRTSGNEYVLRGGSWKSPADALRSAYRIGENPGLLRRLPGPRCHRLPLRAQGAALEGCRMNHVNRASSFILSRRPCSSTPGSSSSSS